MARINIAISIALIATASYCAIDESALRAEPHREQAYKRKPIILVPRARGLTERVAPVGVIESTSDALVRSDAAGNAELRKNERWNGSGYLISPCLVLTAYHVAFGNTPVVPNHDYNIAFSIGAVGNSSRRFTWNNIKATPVAYGSIIANKKSFDLYDDWALLKLNVCPGLSKRVGWLDVDVHQQASEDELGLAGYVEMPFNNKEHLVVLYNNPTRCRSETEPRTKLYLINCKASAGMSGGPVFKGDRRVAVGIIHSDIMDQKIKDEYSGLNPRTAAISIEMVDNVMAMVYGVRLEELIKADICMSGPNKASKRECSAQDRSMLSMRAKTLLGR